MSAAAHAALRPAPDELALADARARVTGQKLASGIFRSPVHLASGLRRSQAANDTGENLAAYDEGTSESCYWVARDPIRFDGGVNLYAYAENDPVNSRDPSGESPICEFCKKKVYRWYVECLEKCDKESTIPRQVACQDQCFKDYESSRKWCDTPCDYGLCDGVE